MRGYARNSGQFQGRSNAILEAPPASASLVVVVANRIVPDPVQPVVANDDLFGRVLLTGVYRNTEIEIEGFRGRIDYIRRVERMATSPIPGASWRLALNRDGQVSGSAVSRPRSTRPVNVAPVRVPCPSLHLVRGRDNARWFPTR